MVNTTFNSLYIKTRNLLRDAKLTSPELEARLIVEKASDKTRAEYIRDGALQAPLEVIEAAQSYTERRLSGEPVAYITGEWEFYSLPVFVNADTLIPRADSEVLVDCAIKRLRSIASPQVLDLCAGSGCLGIAVSKNVQGVELTLADISPGALEMCEKNARQSGIATNIAVFDALEAPPEALRYDMILCNPPYITTDEIKALDKSVRDYEPFLALDGGGDGLRFYRAIAAKWKNTLKTGGYVLLECGAGQAEDVRDILEAEGFTEIETVNDTAGITRVVIGQKNN